MGSRSRREEYGRNARRLVVEEYDPEIQLGRLLAVYDQCVREARRGASH